MPRFVTIGYGDEEGYNRTDKAACADAHAHDARLQQSGVEMGKAGRAIQVRNHEGRQVTVSEGHSCGPICLSQVSQSSMLPIWLRR